MKAKYVLSSVIAVGLFLLLATTAVFAKESLGTLETPKGDTVEKVRMEATITEVGDRSLTVKDNDSGEEYTFGKGPYWFNDREYEVGQKVTLEGVDTSNVSDKRGPEEYNFAVFKLDDVEYRTEMGRPSWAGQGEHRGRGMGMRGFGQGLGFQDEDGNGVCDHME